MNDDFSALRNMKYSGRGIMIGLTLDEKPFIGYSLTGRSPPSQARKLEYDPNQKIISTQVTDKEQLAKGNAALLIYQAVAFVGNGLMIASNGRQTRLLMDAFYSGERSPIHILTKANEIPIIEEIPGIDGKIEKIDLTSFEPDSNFTPRIGGCISNCIDEKLGSSRLGAFYIVRKSSNSSNDKPFFDLLPIKLEPGQARMITTYKGDNESPLLLPFTGNPLEMTVASTTAEKICKSLYGAIGPKDRENYRVAAAVMLMKNNKEVDVAHINRSERKLLEFLQTLFSYIFLFLISY